MIIAAWNAGGVLSDCLDSIARQRLAEGFESIVVDDASTDDTARLLEERGDVRLIRNESNVGFSAANNQAAAVARGEILLFLNSDTILVGADVLRILVEALGDPRVGLVGPRLLNTDGTLQPSCAAHPSVLNALMLASGAHRLLPDRARAHLSPYRWSHDRASDTGWLTGAAIALRARLFADLGGFWPTMYGEDEDLAFRVQRLGLRVRYEPAAQVIHLGNHSLSQRWSDAERAVRVAHAEITFLGTHYRRARATVIRAITLGGYAARALGHRTFGARHRARIYLAMALVYARGPIAARSRVD